MVRGYWRRIQQRHKGGSPIIHGPFFHGFSVVFPPAYIGHFVFVGHKVEGTKMGTYPVARYSY
jgi:hypothetical protein